MRARIPIPNKRNLGVETNARLVLGGLINEVLGGGLINERSTQPICKVLGSN